MPRGNIAKNRVINTIKEAFGTNWVGESDKKFYVWADDGGEKVQIAISLTCPKTFVENAEDVAPAPINDGGMSFEDMPVPQKASKPVEISQEEKDNIAEMMRRLGL